MNFSVAFWAFVIYVVSICAVAIVAVIVSQSLWGLIALIPLLFGAHFEDKDGNEEGDLR